MLEGTRWQATGQKDNAAAGGKRPHPLAPTHLVRAAQHRVQPGLAGKVSPGVTPRSSQRLGLSLEIRAVQGGARRQRCVHRRRHCLALRAQPVAGGAGGHVV